MPGAIIVFHVVEERAVEGACAVEARGRNVEPVDGVECHLHGDLAALTSNYELSCG